MRFFQASVLCALGLLCGVVRAEFGNFYNFWEVTEDGIDLTRGNATNAKMIKGSKNIVINPARSAMIIVDMQSTSLIAVTCSIEVSADADSECISPPLSCKRLLPEPHLYWKAEQHWFGCCSTHDRRSACVPRCRC